VARGDPDHEGVDSPGPRTCEP